MRTWRQPPPPLWPAYARYPLAAGAVVAAWALTSWLWPLISPNVSPLFSAAVLLTAWFCGLGPGLLSVLLAAAASTYFVPFGWSGAEFDAGDLVRGCVLLLVAVNVSWLNAARRRAQRALAVSAALEHRLELRSEELEAANRQLRAEVAQRRAAEDAIQAQQGRLRALSADLALTEERERRQLASELHDGIGQLLAVVRMRMDAAGPPAPEAAREVTALVDRAIAETRRVTRRLSPPVLYEASFGSALEWLAEDMRATHGLRVEVTLRGTPALRDELRLFLFQAARELLVNVVKHAHAARAAVSVFCDADCLRLIVDDDGRGVRPDVLELPRQAHGGFGLLNIRERLTYLGGTIDVECPPGQGSRFTLTVPYADRKMP